MSVAGLTGKPVTWTFVDRFSALDDIPRKHWGNAWVVLAMLQKVGRFSCFEMEGKLASTMTMIVNSNWIAKTWGEYPWTYVELSDAGRAALSQATGGGG